MTLLYSHVTVARVRPVSVDQEQSFQEAELLCGNQSGLFGEAPTKDKTNLSNPVIRGIHGL